MGIIILLFVTNAPPLTTAAPVNQFDRMIVRLKTGSTLSSDFKHLVKAGKMMPGINAFLVEVSSTLKTELRRQPGVVGLEEDGLVHADGDVVGWGLRRINATKVWNTTRGEGVKIAILDTGIDWEHPDLAGIVAGGVCIVCNSSTTDSVEWMDRDGHGTAVAGVIAAQRNGFGVLGAAYGVRLYAVKVLNDTGVGYVSNVIAGIEWAVENNMNIIVMSFSSPDYSGGEAQAVQEAYSKGLLLIASAGNSGPTSGTVGYPAALAGVIAVGATDYWNNVPDWSSRGPELDLAAPGVGVNTTWIGNEYASLSGTSFSVPYVAASAALVWSARSNLTNSEVRSILEETARDLGVRGRDNETGFGLVDSLRAVNLALNRSLNYQPLNITLSLDSSRLASGDTLTGRVFVEDADGGPVGDVPLTASILGGAGLVWHSELKTEMNGWAVLRVALGSSLSEGQYRLSVDVGGFHAYRNITLLGRVLAQGPFSVWGWTPLAILVPLSLLACYFRTRVAPRRFRL